FGTAQRYTGNLHVSLVFLFGLLMLRPRRGRPAPGGSPGGGTPAGPAPPPPGPAGRRPAWPGTALPPGRGRLPARGPPLLRRGRRRIPSPRRSTCRSSPCLPGPWPPPVRFFAPAAGLVSLLEHNWLSTVSRPAQV